MAGIEPASLKGEPGLLRAQLTRRSTRPLRSRQQVAARPSFSWVPNRPWSTSDSASLQKWGQAPGGRRSWAWPFDRWSGSESEVSAVVLGTYWFPCSV